MQPIRTSPPRVVTIEGRRTLVVERRPPLPAYLPDLLRSLRVYPLRITGWRSSCSDQDHRLVPFADGRHRCTDGVVRDLRLRMCSHCESVEVRDVSVDRVPGLGVVRLTRKDHVIGWYSGARRNQRQYT